MFRIIHEPKGWVVEKQEFKFNFLGVHFWKVWRPFVKSSGLDCIWHHSSREYALMNLHHEIKNKLIQ